MRGTGSGLRKGRTRPAASIGRTPLNTLVASITDPIVDVAVDFIDAVGLLGVFVLMTLESACVPVPSEATMLFAGFNVSEGDMTMLGIVTAGVVGNLIGSWMAWAAGYYGRIELLDRNRFIHINPKHLAAADRWFARHGDATVFWCRLLPIIRTFISLPAGVARMPFWRFSVLTLIWCIPWVFMLTFVGKQAGDNWERWKDKLHYVDYAVVALIVLGLAWLLLRYRRRRTDAAAADAA